jgi:hypothetical protein
VAQVRQVVRRVEHGRWRNSRSDRRSELEGAVTEKKKVIKDEIIHCLEEDLYDFEIKIRVILEEIIVLLRDPGVSDAAKNRILKMIINFSSQSYLTVRARRTQ